MEATAARTRASATAGRSSRASSAAGLSPLPESLTPLELEALDVAWRDGRGELLARAAGAEPRRRAVRASALMRDSALERTEVVLDDEELWEAQRARQRSTSNAVVRIAARPSALAEVIALARGCGASLVGRAALGTSYVECAPDAVRRLRDALPEGATAVVLDGPAGIDRWGTQEGPAVELMRRVKQRFDPAGSCNPGVFVGGI